MFGLGSTVYPNYCAFAKAVDEMIQILGGEHLYPMQLGDELDGQQDSFYKWAKGAFKVREV